MHIGKFLSKFSLYKWDQSITTPTEAANQKTTKLGEANLIGSICADKPGFHRPVLDFDFPCMLVESSNGNFHLLIDKPIKAKQYEELLELMTEIGLLNPKTHERFLERRSTFVRTPWCIKPNNDPNCVSSGSDNDGNSQSSADS